MGTIRQVINHEQTSVEPVLIRMLGSQCLLYILVIDNLARDSINEEHPSGLEA